MIDLNNNKITTDDHAYYMGDYTIIEDSTYLGADFFSDNFGLKVRWDRQNGIVQLESVKDNAISIQTVKEASDTDKVKITLQYPKIDGLDDKMVQDSINSIFSNLAVDARNEGLKNADEMEKVIASGYSGSPNKCETYFDYRLKYNLNGLLSIVFLDYQYTGGAHGLTVQSSHTFNLKTGEEYKLKDLVKSDVDYVALISNTVRNEIDEGVKEGILPDYTIAPFEAIKEDQDFYLSNNEVVIYFQQYEYFPYAAGIQEFPIEFSALKDMLKPEFIFLNCRQDKADAELAGQMSKEQIATMIRTQGKNNKDSYYLEGLSYDVANLDDDVDWEIVAQIDGGVHLGQFSIFDKDSGGDYKLVAEQDWKVEQWDFDNPIEIEGKKLFKLVTRTGGTGIDVFTVHLWYLEQGEFIEAWQGTLKERSTMAGPETFSMKVGGYQFNPEDNRLYVWETTHQLDQDGVSPKGDLKTSTKVYLFNGTSFIQES